MIAIVNVNDKWGIGCEGDLLTFIPEDMAFFRRETKGKTVIMGRNTLLSFPKHIPLKGRRNIVMTSSKLNIPRESLEYAESEEAKAEGTILEIVCSVEELLANLGTAAEDAYVIGGEKIYRLLLPYCSRCLVTINSSEREADTYFPDLYKEGFVITEESEEHEYEGLKFRFTVFERRN